jgi:Stress responsive A/B Barrel Domain
VIIHLVLFTPRADLAEEDGAQVGAALEQALTLVPSIVRYQVGRRVRLGATYDAAAPLDFEYCVLIELADRAALDGYLAHPAHRELGRLFYEASSLALASDFETVSGDLGAALSRWRSG